MVLLTLRYGPQCKLLHACTTNVVRAALPYFYFITWDTVILAMFRNVDLDAQHCTVLFFCREICLTRNRWLATCVNSRITAAIFKCQKLCNCFFFTLILAVSSHIHCSNTGGLMVAQQFESQAMWQTHKNPTSWDRIMKNETKETNCKLR